jgi:hypothetical protein
MLGGDEAQVNEKKKEETREKETEAKPSWVLVHSNDKKTGWKKEHLAQATPAGSCVAR